MFRSLMVVAGAFLLSFAGRPPFDQPPQETPYVGADACRDCHPDVHKAWSATKHSRALSKLSPEEQASGKCIKCHVTGSSQLIETEGAKPSFPGVQCEACHGAGRAHVEAARGGDAGNARTKAVDEQTCLACHNESSPHYKPFIYQAMVGLVHRRS